MGRISLEDIYRKYHNIKFIGLDPLICVQRFTKHNDIEIAGLIASSLAYGRVENIIGSIDFLLRLMDYKPHDFTMQTTLQQKRKLISGFKYRFTSANDVCLMLESVAIVLKKYGSIENFFVDGMDINAHTVKQGLASFSSEMKKMAAKIGRARCRGFEYLFPSPFSGSACKRLLMYLRWMIRPNDGIDFGIWKKLKPSQLIMPVDTHIARIAIALGFTKRRQADWKMAEEITELFRAYAPDDPVKFDFSLCRYGMISFRKRGI